MRLGTVLMPTDSWDQTLARAQHLDRSGLDRLWIYDHLSWRRYTDRDWHAIYPLLAGLAVGTERIGLGTMVSNPNIRHPYVLAKDAMTIDHMSHGRLVLGIGAGGIGNDATVFGQAPLTPRQRAERLAEYVTIADGLLRGALVNHEGEWFEVSEARMLPGCVQQPRLPLAVAAAGPKTLRLAADVADMWITFGDPTGEATTAAAIEAVIGGQLDHIEARCAETGRDPSSIERTVLMGMSDERPLSSLEAFIDFVGRYEALGISELVWHDPRSEDPDWNDQPEVIEEIAAWHRNRQPS